MSETQLRDETGDARLTRIEVGLQNLGEAVRGLVDKEAARSKTPWQLITGAIGFIAAAASFAMWVMNGQITSANMPLQLEMAQIHGRLDNMAEVAHGATEERHAIAESMARIDKRLTSDEIRLQDKSLLPPQ